MEKNPSYIETFGALTPPKGNADVDWFTRFAVSGLRGNACWKARPDSPQEAPLIDMVARLCPQMGIQTPPELIIYTSPYPNAASVANGKVVVSDNLLSIMTPEEVESVMAHELAHHRHKSRDNVAILGGIFGGDFAYRRTLQPTINNIIEKVKNAKAKMALYIVKPVVEFLAAVGLVNLYQQKCEYESDRESGEVTGHPKVMAEALGTLGERIGEVQRQERLESLAKMSDTQKVVADTIKKFTPEWVGRILKNPFDVLGSHPPIRSRVEALEAQDARMHPDKSPQHNV